MPVTGQSLVVVGVTLALVIAHVPFLRPLHGGQGTACHGDEPRRRPPDGHSDRAVGRPQLCAGRPDRRRVGPADRAADHGVLRHRFPDRPQGFRRRHHRRHGQLSAGAGRRPAGGPARILFLLLGQRLQGGAGVHPDHPGAVVALDEQPCTWKKTKNDAAPSHRPVGPGAGAGLGLAARIHHHAAVLHRPVFDGGGRPGDAHGRRRHDLVRPGGVRGCRCLCHRLGLHLAGRRRRAGRMAGPGLAALAGPAAGPGADGGRGLGSGRHHAQAVRPLPAAGDHRLGPEHLLPVRQSRSAGRPDRHHRRAAAGDRRSVAGRAAGARAGDLGDAAAGAVGAAQPAGFARRVAPFARSRAAA